MRHFLQMLVLTLVLLPQPHARASGGEATAAIGEFITNNLETLVDSLGNWGVNSIEFGQNDGFIFRGILSIGRTVQRNEHPEGLNDKFLVKDELKVGIRLGVGMGISGDVSFVRKYTLIYPAETRLKAAFKNKFIVNLILPYQAHTQKLPHKYVLMVEDSVEGRGRIKVGATLLIPIGVEGSASVIHLARFFTAKQAEDSMVFLEDKENSYKFAFQIYAHLLFLDIPFAEGYIARGKNRREILHINPLNIEKEKYRKAFKHFIRHGKLEEFSDMGRYQNLSGKFTESYHNFELPLFLQHLKIWRYDEYNLQGQDNPELNGNYMQFFNYRRRKWWLPGTGETHWHQVTVAMREDQGTVIKQDNRWIRKSNYQPHLLHITLRTSDNRTKKDEMIDGYLPLINQIASRPDFLKVPLVPIAKFEHWGKTNLWLEIFIFDKALSKLMSMSRQEYWRLVSLATETPDLADLATVEIIQKNKLKYIKRWRIIRPFWNAWKDLARAQERDSEDKEFRKNFWLNQAVLTLVKRGRQSYRPLYVKWLRLLAQEASPSAPDYFLQARMIVPEDRIEKINDIVLLENHEGTDRRAQVFETPFVFYDMQVIWSMFL